MDEKYPAAILHNGRAYWPEPPEPKAERFAAPFGSVAVRFDMMGLEVKNHPLGGVVIGAGFQIPGDTMHMQEIVGGWETLPDVERLRILRGAILAGFEDMLDQQLQLPDGSTPFKAKPWDEEGVW